MRFAPILLAAMAAWGQTETTFEGRPALTIGNDRIELLLLPQGGAFASLVLKSDKEGLNPMWNPLRLARQAGRPVDTITSTGHFVCVDGFGPTSTEERAAGLMGHGEAHRQPWKLVGGDRKGKRQSYVFSATLPVVQEVFTRRLEVIDGEEVVYVDSELESLLGFDRPVNWAEHATIGPPFLAPGRTVVDVSAGRCMTRPELGKSPPVPRRIVPGEDFNWPMAPATGGGTADLRYMPAGHNSMDHSGCTVDPAQRLAWVTALNLDKRLLLGYVWRREEFPWIQKWMNYPPDERTAWGLEFGTQPFDVPRRETVDLGKMFDVPAFRWLPAKSKIGARYLMFYTRVPEGFERVDELTYAEEKIALIDKKSGKQVDLSAAGGI